MIKINLLSPQKKKEVEEKVLYIAIKNVLAIFLIFAVLVSIILLGSKLILAYNFETVVEQTTLIVKEYGDVNKKIRDTNNKLENIKGAQDEFIYWSKYLVEINKLVPEDIKIAATVLKNDEGQALLKGFAKTRNDLLILKTNLESSNLFKKVGLPFSNLLKRADIDFEFQLTLKPHDDISKN